MLKAATGKELGSGPGLEEGVSLGLFYPNTVEVRADSSLCWAPTLNLLWCQCVSFGVDLEKQN